MAFEPTSGQEKVCNYWFKHFVLFSPHDTADVRKIKSKNWQSRNETENHFAIDANKTAEFLLGLCYWAAGLIFLLSWRNAKLYPLTFVSNVSQCVVLVTISVILHAHEPSQKLSVREISWGVFSLSSSKLFSHMFQFCCFMMLTSEYCIAAKKRLFPVCISFLYCSIYVSSCCSKLNSHFPIPQVHAAQGNWGPLCLSVLWLSLNQNF